MPKYLIEMPEGWEAGDCYVCPIKCAPIAGKHYPCINPPCPLSHAKPAVEITTDHMETYDDKPTTLDDLLPIIEQALRGAGYSFNGNLDIVEE